MTESGNSKSLDAEKVVKSFGGIRPMANKLGIPVTTVQGWKKRGSIPSNRIDEILKAAAENGIDLGVEGKSEEKASKPEADSVQTAPETKEAAVSETAKDTENSSTQIEEDNNNKGEEEEMKEEQPIKLQARAPNTKKATAPKTEYPTHDELMKRLQGVESKASRQATIFSSILIIITACALAFILWPTEQRQAVQIASLEKDIQNVKSSINDTPAHQPTPHLDAIKEQTQSLTAKFGDLGERVKQLETRIESITSFNPQLSSLISRVDELSKTVEGQETLNSSLDQLNFLVNGLEGRMDHLDDALVVAREQSKALNTTFEGVSNSDLKAAAMLLAMTQLRESLGRDNQPFGDDLQLLSNMVGDDDPELQSAIDKLAPVAEQGVLTPAGLADELKGIAGEVVVASLKGEDVSIKEKAAARMNEILKVEKDGELVTGTDTEKTLATAQQQLQDGNIKGAMDLLKGFDGESAEILAPFMDKANASLQAQNAGETIGNFLKNNIPTGTSNVPYSANKMKGFSTFAPVTSGDSVSY